MTEKTKCLVGAIIFTIAVFVGFATIGLAIVYNFHKYSIWILGGYVAYKITYMSYHTCLERKDAIKNKRHISKSG